VFNDYLYTQFEEGVASAILQPKGLTPDNCYSLLNSAFLVKVQGPAEIEDYHRFTYTAEQFLTVVSDIALVSHSGTVKTLMALIEAQIPELQQQSKNSTGTERSRINSQISDLQRELKVYQDPEKLKHKLVAEMGLEIDTEYMKGIARIFQHFSPDNFEVTISPSEDAEGVVFRGVLDKNLLRIHPEYLRVLYEGSVSKQWTMVGEITHFPKSVSSPENTSPLTETTPDAENVKDNSPGMKDILRNVFRSLADMESNFFESKNRVEIRVRPLAIYQEIQIPLQ
jgi:hypothetical protein